MVRRASTCWTRTSAVRGLRMRDPPNDEGRLVSERLLTPSVAAAARLAAGLDVAIDRRCAVDPDMLASTLTDALVHGPKALNAPCGGPGHRPTIKLASAGQLRGRDGVVIWASRRRPR